MVVDNSSCFRYEADIPLIVPEVNGHNLNDYDLPGIIANPNCSTIQMLVALKPIHDEFKIERIDITTLQAVSGTGKEATEELQDQLSSYEGNKKIESNIYPKQFDVIVTGNLFGDILSDIAAMLTGSIGMLPSASLNSDNKGMYEPVHGSAPDITGKELANPIAAILSVAMMLKYSFNMNEASSAIENSIQEVLSEGYRTYDLEGSKENKLSTFEMGNKIIEKIK